MAFLFKDELHEDFGTWPLGYTPYGGGDFGEIRAVAEAVGDGDDTAYYEAWNAAGDRLKAAADVALGKGHIASARALYLRASAFYATSFHPLYGAPVDPRLLAAFAKQVAAFNVGLALEPTPVQPAQIPCGEIALPAYLIPAQNFERDVRPLIIFNNGTISTTRTRISPPPSRPHNAATTAWCSRGPARARCFISKACRCGRIGSGDPCGGRFRRAAAHCRSKKIALSGWSLGGYLAPRGASGEPRIAALIADPGTWSIADGFRDVIVPAFGLAPEAAKDLGALDEALLERLDAYIRADRKLNWKIVQRGFWVHGVDNLRAYFASAELFTMQGHAERIQCPTLITMAENDTLSERAGTFMGALRCPKTLMHFTAAEGADGHCSMQNRSLLNQRVLDWLDEQFAR